MTDCPPPENIWHEVRNDQGQIIAKEGRTIVYKCGDAMTELIVKIQADAKAADIPEPPK